jgi:D-alanyl-D-alanine carboxypeptidase (penicillin-binding protein 5/6)
VAAPAIPAPVAAVREANADPRLPPAEVNAVPIALLVDLSSGQVLYAKQANRRFLPASVTKVMTLYTAFDLMGRKQISPSQRYRMSEQAFKQWHRVGSTMFLDRSMAPSVHDLLLGIANISANDGCIVLAEGAAGSVPTWVALMNAEAGKLGMRDSHFGTPNGWMDEGQTYVTAHDLATLAAAILAEHPDDYHRYIGHETMTWNGITQHNHDPILGHLEGADGIKTGFTNQAGYNFLGSAERNGRRLVMVIAGADRPADRAKAAKALMDWGFAAFSNKPLFKAGETIGSARVQGGGATKVSLVMPSGFTASIPKDAADKTSLKIVYNGPITAPIQQGTIVASLEIRTGDGEPHRIPLIAGESVAQAGLLARLRNGLLGLVT